MPSSERQGAVWEDPSSGPGFTGWPSASCLDSTRVDLGLPEGNDAWARQVALLTNGKVKREDPDVVVLANMSILDCSLDVSGSSLARVHMEDNVYWSCKGSRDVLLGWSRDLSSMLPSDWGSVLKQWEVRVVVVCRLQRCVGVGEDVSSTEGL